MAERSFVDFAWSDGIKPQCSAVLEVGNFELRIVERRRDQGHPGRGGREGRR